MIDNKSGYLRHPYTLILPLHHTLPVLHPPLGRPPDEILLKLFLAREFWIIYHGRC